MTTANPAPRSLPTTRLPSISPSGWLLIVLVLLYTVGFSVLSIRPHTAQLTSMADLGQIDLAIWNTSQGRFVQEVKGETVSTRLTDHVEPIFLAVGLVFRLWDDVRALLIVQTLALALGAFPVYWLARDLLGSVSQVSARAAGGYGLLFAFTYLMFPALQAANLTEFHAIPLAVPCVLFAFWFLHKRQWVGFLAANLLLLTVKEEAALLALMLGLAAAWIVARDAVRAAPRGTRLRALARGLVHPPAGLLVMGLSLAWFLTATFVIIPHYASQVYGVEQSVYFDRFGPLGDSPLSIVRSIFTRPDVVWQIASEAPRVNYLLGLLASAGFLSLLGPEILLLGAPLLLVNLFSTYPAQYSGEFHYSAPLVPYFVVAAILGARRIAALSANLAQRGRGIGVPRTLWVLAGWLLVWVVVYQVIAGWTPIGREFRWDTVTPHQRLLDRFAPQVPAEEPGSVTTGLYPHFSHREKLYKFPLLGDATWALVDVTGTTDAHPVVVQEQVLDLLQVGWRVIDAADGYVLLRRPADSDEPGATAACDRGAGPAAYAACMLPDAFFDFARASRSGLLPDEPGRVVLPGAPALSLPTPSITTSLVFSSSLALRGVDVIDDGKWGLTYWRGYWRADQRLPADLQVRQFAVTPDGALADDPALRPPVALLWYPPARWTPGETALVETLPWYLPAQWAPAVGVFEGADWNDRGRRWPVSGEAPRFDGSTWAQLPAYQRQGRTLRPLEPPPASATTAPLAQWAAADGGTWGSLLGATLPTTPLVASQPVTVTLTWRLAQPSAHDYAVFAHLRDAAGRTVTQADGQPVWFGVRPFTTWSAGTPGADVRVFEAGTLQPGETYEVVVGLYDPATSQRLDVIGPDGSVLGNEVTAATLTTERE